MTTATANASMTKNQRRRLKKKQEREKQHLSKVDNRDDVSAIQDEGRTNNGIVTPAVEIEYVSMNIQQELALPQEDPAYEEFMRIFNKFSSAEELCGGATTDEDTAEISKGSNYDHNQDDDDKNDDIDVSELQLSRKQRKKGKRLTVAELKQLVPYPDAVEAHDVTSADPRFLVFLKSYRNTVPVPQHWCHKRKYLQGKRGVEKQPFLLPDFIANTGIAEIRSVVGEEDDKKRSKQKMRERMQPKMGRVDIDYQVLHDAFFRFQTKPALTILGDLYYEGKEFEVKLKTKVPGQLSDELKQALGMVDGVPPPWLLNMQRYGPPPAYPNLKIPGLNAPIPEGASFGYHPGGWGKPPVDDSGKPLYGDVFTKPIEADNVGQQVNRERWGELEEVEAPVEEEEEEEEGKEEDTVNHYTSIAGLDATGMETPLADGMASVSSIASGLTTPGGVVDMRKGIRGTDTPEISQQLYTVLEQKETSVGTSLYGSGHGYVVPGTEPSSSGTRSVTGRVRRRFEDVPPDVSTSSTGEVSVAPSSVAAEDEAAKKKKKMKSEKSKKLNDFKF